jgi:hypothetical protein
MHKRSLMPLPLADRKSDLAALLKRRDDAIRYGDRSVCVALGLADT